MAQARIDAAHYLADCVKCGELIPLDELQAAWPVTHAAVNEAVAAGGFVAQIGPSAAEAQHG